MAMRSFITRASLTRSVETTRAAATRCFSDGKGKVLSEEERAKENVYIQKWEKERLEKMKQQTEKLKGEKDKEGAEKKSEGESKDV